MAYKISTIFEPVGFYRNVSIVSQDFVKYEMTLREKYRYQRLETFE